MVDRGKAEDRSLVEDLNRSVDLAMLELLAAVDRCAQGSGEAAVHALRLLIRRQAPVWQVARDAGLGGRRIRELLERTAHLMKATGPLRDAHVRLAALNGRRRGQLWRTLHQRTSGEVRDLEQEVQRLCRRLIRKGTLDRPCRKREASAEQAIQALEDALDRRWKRLQRRIRRSGPGDVRSLHKARLTLKRYRYLIAAFVDHVPPRHGGRLIRLEALQQRLGRWHDDQLLATWMEDRIPELPLALQERCANEVRTLEARCVREAEGCRSALRRLAR